MQTRKAVITHALRTPLGAMGGGFAAGGAVSLGVELVQSLLKSSGLKPEAIQRVWLGQARPDPEHPNVAGIVAYRAGIPMRVSACTITQGAASGLQAILAAAQAVLSGETELAIAGGVDCPSSVPRLAGDGENLENGPGGLWCALLREPCGMAAEHLAGRFQVTPEEMIAFAKDSQNKARSARVNGLFDAQVASVHQRNGDGDLSKTIKSDEYLLNPPPEIPGFPFKKEGGQVPGTSVASLADGAAGLVIMSKEEADRRGFTPLVYLGQGRSSGSDPRFAGLAAIDAVYEVCGNAGIHPSSFDLVELGETFAVDALVTMRELKLHPERVNVGGGDLALGHAFGATSARMVISLVHEMARRDVRKGLVAIATCGGIGVAASFYRFSGLNDNLFSMPKIEDEVSRQPGGEGRRKRRKP